MQIGLGESCLGSISKLTESIARIIPSVCGYLLMHTSVFDDPNKTDLYACVNIISCRLKGIS